MSLPDELSGSEETMTEEILETLFLLFIAGVLALHDCHATEPPKCQWKTCKMLNLQTGFEECTPGQGTPEQAAKAQAKAMKDNNHFIVRCDGEEK